MFLVFLGILFVVIYATIMCIKIGGIPPSISETFYHGGGIWFTITLFISSFLITAGLLILSEGSPWQFVSFFTGAGMGFVGAAPHIHTEERKIHAVAASILMSGSQLWICLFGNPWTLLCWIFLPFYWKKYSKIFWIEITCISSIGLTLLLL
jgi:hypothetical protein